MIRGRSLTTYRPHHALDHGMCGLMCVGLVSLKTPATRCLISKMPDFSKMPTYNHKIISRPRLCMHGVSQFCVNHLCVSNKKCETPT